MVKVLLWNKTVEIGYSKAFQEVKFQSFLNNGEGMTDLIQ